MKFDPGERGMTPYQQRAVRSEEAILEALEEGVPLTEAAAAGGIKIKALWERRKADPTFAARVLDAIDVGNAKKRAEAESRRNRRVKRLTKLVDQKHEAIERARDTDPEAFDAALRAQLGEDPEAFLSKVIRDEVEVDKIDGRASGIDQRSTVVAVQTNVAVGIGGAQSSLSVRDLDAFLYEDIGLPRGSVYRRVAWILRQADRADVRRVLVCAGKGSGKGYVASLLLARQLQRLFAAPADAQGKVLGQGPHPRLGVINLSASGGDQAQLAVFTDLRRWLAGPWFARLPKPTRDVNDLIEWELPDRIVVAFCGNSSSKGAEGINFVAAVADEVCRLPEKESANVESADRLVGPVEATLVTRFGDVYKLAVSSWPESQTDYLHREVARVRDAGGKEGQRAGVLEDLTASFLGEPPSWDPPDPAREEALRQPPFGAFASEAFLSRDGTLVVHAPVWVVKPDCSLAALRQMEQRDPVGFASMCGARPRSVGENAYLKDPDVVRLKANPARAHPVEGGQLVAGVPIDQNTLYWGHLDGAARRDAAGIAVGHYADGRVVIDLSLEVRAPEGGELNLVDDLVAWFRVFQDRGATFSTVTHDGWMGIALEQAIKRLGIRSEAYSVDRTSAAYDTWRDAVYADRVDYYPYDPVFDGARDLVKVGQKVDHRPNGKKDCLDAVVAVTYHVMKAMGGYVASGEPAGPEEKIPPEA